MGKQKKKIGWSIPAFLANESVRENILGKGRQAERAVYLWGSPLLPGERELTDLPLGWAECQRWTRLATFAVLGVQAEAIDGAASASLRRPLPGVWLLFRPKGA